MTYRRRCTDCRGEYLCDHDGRAHGRCPDCRSEPAADLRLVVAVYVLFVALGMVFVLVDRDVRILYAVAVGVVALLGYAVAIGLMGVLGYRDVRLEPNRL